MISDELGLIDEGTLNESRVSGWLRDFLPNARRPSFAYFAPALRFLSCNWFRETVEQDRGSE